MWAYQSHRWPYLGAQCDWILAIGQHNPCAWRATIAIIKKIGEHAWHEQQLAKQKRESKKKAHRSKCIHSPRTKVVVPHMDHVADVDNR
jgi:hypothetical protein